MIQRNRNTTGPGRLLIEWKPPKKLWTLVIVMLSVGVLSWARPAGAEETVEDLQKRGQQAYERGDVVDAMKWYRMAAQRGYAPAQTRLARLMDASEQNEQAVKWYREAAAQSFPEAEYELGLMYAAGEGVKKDNAEAVRWLVRAAEHDHPPAIRALALAHANGSLGLQSDDQKTVLWLEKGAALDDQWSIGRLATAYRKGEFGLTPDQARAGELEAKLPSPKADKKEAQRR